MNLHRICSHPDYEYATTQGPRKAWYDENIPPEGEGWEKNVDCGNNGWERFDYHEESYWRRKKPMIDQPLKEPEPENVIDQLENLVGHEVVIFTNKNAIFDGLLNQITEKNATVNDYNIKRKDIQCVWDHGAITTTYLIVPMNHNEKPWIVKILAGKSISDYFIGHDDQLVKVFEIRNNSVFECDENDGSRMEVEEKCS